MLITIDRLRILEDECQMRTSANIRKLSVVLGCEFLFVLINMDQQRLCLILCTMYCIHYSQAVLPFEMSINNKLYFLRETTTNATNAAAQCASHMLGELAFFASNDEYLAVGEHLTSYFHDPKRTDLCVWIAINATVNDVSNLYDHWWQLESVNKTIWAPQEPNSVCVKPDSETCCVRITWQDTRFNSLRDADCSFDKCYYLCRSVNECREDMHDCSQSQICVDKALGFECVCKAGYNLTADGKQCVDFNECLSNPCDHICINIPGSYNCQCRWGYSLNNDGHTCRDINECASGICNHTCTNSIGSFQCSCLEGFLLAADNCTCTDLDECATQEPLCQHHCDNEAGTFSCSCNPGYTLSLDNNTCEVVDHCFQDPKPCPGPCVNTLEGYSCGCPGGFQEVTSQCIDVDECTTHTHNCAHMCQNTNGSYICKCLPGYTMPANNTNTCIDIDECMGEIPICNQTCLNTDGSYSCSCINGYTLDRRDNTSCIDVNECEDRHGCQHTCNNLPGSFSCSCLAGYLLQEDGLSCVQTTQPYECPCNCHALAVLKNYRLELFTQKTKEMQRNITINKHNISSAVRKKSSILNTKTTETAVGQSGVTIVAVIFGVIVLLDVLNVVRYILFKCDQHHIKNYDLRNFDQVQ